MADYYLDKTIIKGVGFVSLLELDVDVNAERVAIYDSDTFELIVTKNCDVDKTLKLLFDESYASTEFLNVVITDLDNVYNAAILSKVSCLTIDVNAQL